VSGYSLFLTNNEAVLALKTNNIHDASAAAQKSVLRMQLVSGHAGLHATGEEQLAATASYFFGP
jgi:hypothetical protein